MPGRRITYAKDAAIYCEGDQAATLYEIEVGVVRTCRYFPNGSRYVTGIFGKGQIFGAEAALYWATAEAVTGVTLIARARDWLDSLAAAQTGAASHLLSLALQNAEKRVHLLVLKGAPARLAGFLLSTAEIVGGRHCVHLPMRADIADYLAIDVATVSRVLSRFVNQRLLIPIERHGYVIHDIRQLEAVASGDAWAACSGPAPSQARRQASSCG